MSDKFVDVPHAERKKMVQQVGAALEYLWLMLVWQVLSTYYCTDVALAYVLYDRICGAGTDCQHHMCKTLQSYLGPAKGNADRDAQGSHLLGCLHTLHMCTHMQSFTMYFMPPLCVLADHCCISVLALISVCMHLSAGSEMCIARMCIAAAGSGAIRKQHDSVNHCKITRRVSAKLTCTN